MKNERQDEIGLYPKILDWLQVYLENKHPEANVSTHDVHSIELSAFLGKSDYKKFFPEYSTFNIRVDLLGVVFKDNNCSLVFIEVKNTKLSLINLSQLLGYCKVVQPSEAFLVSPKGISPSLNKLLLHFNRLDILEYGSGKRIKVGIWDTERNFVNNNSLIK